jgi:hypothetical protein
MQTGSATSTTSGAKWPWKCHQQRFQRRIFHKKACSTKKWASCLTRTSGELAMLSSPGPRACRSLHRNLFIHRWLCRFTRPRFKNGFGFELVNHPYEKHAKLLRFGPKTGSKRLMLLDCGLFARRVEQGSVYVKVPVENAVPACRKGLYARFRSGVMHVGLNACSEGKQVRCWFFHARRTKVLSSTMTLRSWSWRFAATRSALASKHRRKFRCIDVKCTTPSCVTVVAALQANRQRLQKVAMHPSPCGRAGGAVLFCSLHRPGSCCCLMPSSVE